MNLKGRIKGMFKKKYPQYGDQVTVINNESGQQLKGEIRTYTPDKIILKQMIRKQPGKYPEGSVLRMYRFIEIDAKEWHFK